MDKLLDEHNIKSLIHLLEDDDEETYKLIFPQIMDMGSELIPYIIDAEERSISPVLSSRLKEIYSELNLQTTIKELTDWKLHNSRNLYQGLTIIAKYQYPHIELRKVSEIINKIRQDLWLEINDNLTALEKVRIINHLFFDVYKFRGDTTDYYAPENSFINDILIRKKGNPLNLSAIYSIIAQSVNIPIYGVNLPRNYMLVYVEKLYSQTENSFHNNDILFYINPFNRGEIHSQNDIFNYLKRINLPVEEQYYMPCSNIITISRSINNLINIYKHKNEEVKMYGFQQLLKVL